MSFKSLDQILGAIEATPAQLEFQRLLKCWSEVVGTTASAQTRPLSISRGILWVATSSSTWAQELSFKRHLLVKKLNEQLGEPLVDIRFSTAQWSRPSQPSRSVYAEQQMVAWQEHPSRVPGELSEQNPHQVTGLKDPKAAFNHWAKGMQMRSQQMPLCPQCQCPTPPGELQRWNVCALCATRQWQR